MFSSNGLLLALAYQVAAPRWSHLGGMFRASRKVAAIAGAIRSALPIRGDGHLSTQNNVRGFGSVSMFGVVDVGPIFPYKDVREALASEFCDQVALLHAGHCISKRNEMCRTQPYRECRVAPLNTTTPLPDAMGVAQERARRLQERSLLVRGELLRRRRWRHIARATRHALVHAGTAAALHLLHRVIRGHGKQVGRRLRALNVC
jgi:hypothetical protein